MSEYDFFCIKLQEIDKVDIEMKYKGLEQEYEIYLKDDTNTLDPDLIVKIMDEIDINYNLLIVKDNLYKKISPFDTRKILDIVSKYHSIESLNTRVKKIIIIEDKVYIGLYLF